MLHYHSMGFGYTVRKKEYNFDPKRHGKVGEKGSITPFAISRSKIDLFIECPRCFYLDQRMGIKRPDSYPLTLNNAVDELMKREFDILRTAKKAHPLMEFYKIDAIPFSHPDLENWRDAMRNGVKYVEPTTGLLIRGGIDDVWINNKSELHVVDYKATSKKEEVTLDAEWQNAYKRQVEVYQWLFQKNGFTVSPIAYFVYANGNSDAEKFDGTLAFELTIIPYEGKTTWIEPTVKKIYACLMYDETPEPAVDCPYCEYRTVAGKALYTELMVRRKKEKLHDTEKI